MAAALLPAIMAAAGSAATAFISGAAISFGSILFSFASSLVMGAIQRALAPKPDEGGGVSADQGQTFTQAVRQAITTRRHVYGQTRVSGPYAYIGSTSDNNFLHLVILTSSDKCAGWNEIWVDDNAVSPDHLDAQGNVITGPYKDHARFIWHDGDPNQVADPNLVAEVSEWTANHRLRGMSYLYARLKYNPDIYPGGIPNLSVIQRGKLLIDARDGMAKFSSNACMFWHDYMSSQEYGPGADADSFNLDNITAQLNIADEYVDVEALDAKVKSIDTATNIITLDALDRTPYQLADRVEVLVTGGAAPGGLATGTDYYAIPYQFKGVVRMKLAASMEDAMAQIAIDITSAGSGTITIRRNGEPRYHGAGVADTANKIQDNILDILSACGGRQVFVGGKYWLYAAAWTEPVITLGIDDFVGPIKADTRISHAERFNTLQGLYISSSNDFQPTDYPQVGGTDALVAQDGGNKITKQLDLPYTNRSTTAQRIVTIELERGRQEIVFNCSCTLRAMIVQAGNNVMLDLEKWGFDGKNFEATSFGLAMDGGDETTGPLLTVNLIIRETAPEIFAWDKSMPLEADPAPNTNLPNALVVAALQGVSYFSRAVGTQDGDSVFSLGLTWNEHPNAFVFFDGQFEIQFKRSVLDDGVTPNPIWRPSFFVAGSLTQSDILTTTVNVHYDLRIRPINNLGVHGPWVTILNAVAGTTGGVVDTEDYGDFHTSPTDPAEDWGDFHTAPSSSEDRGYFT